jgi:hypothetical protein
LIQAISQRTKEKNKVFIKTHQSNIFSGNNSFCRHQINAFLLYSSAQDHGLSAIQLSKVMQITTASWPKLVPDSLFEIIPAKQTCVDIKHDTQTIIEINLG